MIGRYTVEMSEVVVKRTLGKNPTQCVMSVKQLTMEQLCDVDNDLLVELQNRLAEVVNYRKQIMLNELRKQQEALILQMAAITGVTPTNVLVIQRGPRNMVDKPKANPKTGKIETEEETAKRLKKNEYSTMRKNTPRIAKMVRYNAAKSAAKKLANTPELFAKWEHDWPKGGADDWNDPKEED